jgi:nitric oxide reductase NorQ protein
MAHVLGRPLVTVSCHEDLTSSDLVGRFLLEGRGDRLAGRPADPRGQGGGHLLSGRDRRGAHRHHRGDPPADRPSPPAALDKKSQIIDAHEDFMLVISYNPGYQTVLKDLKPSTKQRFVGLQFDYPAEDVERQIVKTESGGLDDALVEKLVAAGRKARALKDHGLEEATSTRALCYAAELMNAGLSPMDACRAALIHPITDDPELVEALEEIFQAHFGESGMNNRGPKTQRREDAKENVE